MHLQVQNVQTESSPNETTILCPQLCMVVKGDMEWGRGTHLEGRGTHLEWWGCIRTVDLRHNVRMVGFIVGIKNAHVPDATAMGHKEYTKDMYSIPNAMTCTRNKQQKSADLAETTRWLGNTSTDAAVSVRNTQNGCYHKILLLILMHGPNSKHWCTEHFFKCLSGHNSLVEHKYPPTTELFTESSLPEAQALRSCTSAVYRSNVTVLTEKHTLTSFTLLRLESVATVTMMTTQTVSHTIRQYLIVHVHVQCM